MPSQLQLVFASTLKECLEDQERSEQRSGKQHHVSSCFWIDSKEIINKQMLLTFLFVRLVNFPKTIVYLATTTNLMRRLYLCAYLCTNMCVDDFLGVNPKIITNLMCWGIVARIFLFLGLSCFPLESMQKQVAIGLASS